MKKEKIDENEYIDLGLPSGTLWKSYNEDRYYTWEEAINKFKDTLPTVEQFYELQKECKFEWVGAGYKVTGQNCNYIYLPAEGFTISLEDGRYIGSYGYYWTSTPFDSERAWNICFDSSLVGIEDDYNNLKQSVRLVSKSKNR